MAFSYLRQLPTPAEILERLPLGAEQAAVKQSRDAEIRAALTGRDPRFIVVIGPCSADNEEAVCEYAGKLAILQYKVKDKIIIIPRVYTNKPRTTGEGYKGMAHQPVLDEEPNIIDGILAIRRMHMRVLADTGMPAADEMLYPGNYPFLEDVLGYVAVGARSVENQEHRLTASGLDIPAGMKNPTSGDLSVMLNSVQAAQKPHVFTYKGWEVATTGNPLAHSILRGAVNQYGQSIPNFHYEDLTRLCELYQKRGLANPAAIVDTNHANSAKQFKDQPRIAYEVLQSRKQSPALAALVRGLMVESYLEEGAQETSGKRYGQSVTDPCLGWKDSERLVLAIAEML